MAISLVNHTPGLLNNVTSSASITIAPTTAGNTLIVVVQYLNSGGTSTDSSVTLGGSVDNFIKRVSNQTFAPYNSVWEDFNCAGGQTSLTVSFTGGTGTYAALDVYEVAGLINTGAFDQQVHTGANSATFSSGATPTTTQANEFVVGAAAVEGVSILPTAAGWTNEAVQSWNTGTYAAVSGYQIVSATGTFTYSGTNTSTDWCATVATFKAPAQAAFPEGPLGVKAEILLNNAWTDISAFLDHDQADSQEHPAAVSITRGRQDETATSPTPSQATFKLWNIDGRFCWRNPSGAYYPYLNRNTPVRFSIPGTTGSGVTTSLQLQSDAIGYASCPDTTGLHITGVLDIRIDLTPMAYPTDLEATVAGSSLIGKWSNSTAGDGYSLVYSHQGEMFFFWFDGTNKQQLSSGVYGTVQLGQRIALRVVFTASTGVAQFYTAPNMSGTWTLIATQTFGATTLAAGTGTPITIGKTPGWTPLVAQVYEVQVYSSSTLKADPVFSSQTGGVSAFNDAQGNTWSMNGFAQIITSGNSARDYRFFGQLASLPVTWDPTGNDVWADVTANGVLRRLQQGNQPNVYSTMRRFLQYSPAPFTPVALWPCEDAQGSNAIASGLPGGLQMQISGAPNLASDSSFACSNPLPVINSSTWTGKVAPYTATGVIVIRFLMSVPSGTATINGSTILSASIAGGTCTSIAVQWGTGGTLTFFGVNSAGTIIFNTGAQAFNVDGTPVLVSLEVGTIDGVFQETVRTMAPGTGLPFSGGVNTSLASVGTVTSVTVNPVTGAGGTIPDIVIGQISVQSAAEDTQDLMMPLNAWSGEPAGLRVARLCQENGIACRVDGTWGNTVTMGFQIPDTLMNLLQSCEDTDRGQVYEPRDFLGLAYRTLDSLTNQTPALTLDYNQDHMTPPLTPTDDDLYTVNDVTVTNQNSTSAFSGSTAQVTLNDGSPMSIGVIGDYANSYDVNTETDDMLPDEAGWILHTSTDPNERYPSVVVNLTSSQPQIASIAAATEAVDIGSHMQIVNIPSFMPPGPVDILAWGYTELLGDFCNEIAFNTIPENPYQVAAADDATRGYADTPGSTLNTGITATATSLSVASSSDLWTTVAGNFPFNITMDGEEMTVTSITGSSSPQTFTVIRSVNGIVKSHNAGAVIDLFQPAYAALTA